MEGYCVKCKSKLEMKNEKKVTMKNGRPATQGICNTCGTKMFKIGGGRVKTAAAPKAKAAKKKAAKKTSSKAKVKAKPKSKTKKK